MLHTITCQKFTSWYWETIESAQDRWSINEKPSAWKFGYNKSLGAMSDS